MFFSWFFELSFILQGAFLFFVMINLGTFLLFALDKAKAVNGSRRVRERTLWILMFCGGSPGALLAMSLFRHKTKKQSFQAVALFILLIQFAALFFFLERLDLSSAPRL